MKKITKLILVIISLSMLILLLSWYLRFQDKAKESYIGQVAKSIHLAEQSYHQEWKKYSASQKDVGFSTDIKDITIYTKKEDIPESELNKINPENYPLFEAETYKMILKWTNKDNGVESLWILDETGFVKKIE